MPLEVKHLSHTYAKGEPEETQALADVSFTVEDGEFLAIIGHTGSGKSTLLQHLDGLLRPDAGSITIHGTVITDPKTPKVEIRRRLGAVFQYPDYQLLEETVSEDVAFGPKNLGIEGEALTQRVDHALRLTGLDPDTIGDKSPFELSGGQKRRVAIAGVLAMKPDLMILDEPTAGLDPQARQELLSVIGRIHKEEGNITILVSHNMDDVARMADKVLVMDQGRAVMFGTPREVFSRGEELEGIGLGVPGVTALIRGLNRKGYHLPEELLDREQAAEAIAAAVQPMPNVPDAQEQRKG